MFKKQSNLRCVHRQDEKHHPNCFRNGMLKSTPEYPKVLVLDIETLPILGYAWGAWEQNIYPEQIVKDWCVLSYSAKWLESDRILSDILTPKEAIARDDARLTANVWKLLDTCTVTITHNGRRFDIRKLNTRFWKNNLHRPSSYKVIDTLVSARSVFGLTFNKLDYIAKFKDTQRKIETDFGLWSACDRGEKESLQKMREYNEQDARTQEEIYLKMREWIPNHPDFRIYAGLKDVCPICLENNYKLIGLYTASRLQYDEYRCSNCGSIWHDTKSKKE